MEPTLSASSLSKSPDFNYAITMASVCTNGRLRQWVRAFSLRAQVTHQRNMAFARGERQGRKIASASSKTSAPIRRRISSLFAEAITFNQNIGLDRKAERLRYLRQRWADQLASNPESQNPATVLLPSWHAVSECLRASGRRPQHKLNTNLCLEVRHLHVGYAACRIHGYANHAERLHRRYRKLITSSKPWIPN